MKKNSSSFKQWQKALIIVVIFAAIGSIIFALSHAATPSVSTEPESGSVTAPAKTITDTAASNGQAVQFATSPTPPPSTGGFTVVGPNILDANGKAVVLHGMDRTGLEFQCAGAATTDLAIMHSKWNADSVRIAVDQDYWLSGSSHYCSGYQATVDGVVQAARAQGMIAIIDLHWSDKGNLSNAPGQQCMPDNNSLTFWKQAAAKYKSNPFVWFELYNEPHPDNWTIWKNGGSVCGFTAVGMQAMYDAVRSTGATNIVIAGGDGYASHLNGVPLLTGTNLAYGIHPYAADSSGGNANNWSPSDWDNRFGNLAKTNPVVATEFGDKQCGSTYDQGIMDYLSSHKISFTAWAWHKTSCNYPSLISDDAGDCLKSQGCTFQQDMLKYPKDSYK